MTAPLTTASASGAPTETPTDAWYLVHGRCNGDDDDSVAFYYVDSPETAKRCFAEDLGFTWAEGKAEARLNTDTPASHRKTGYIHGVWNCGQTRPTEIP